VRGDLKASTVRALRETVRDVCGDWLAAPLVKRTPDRVEVRHREYGRRSRAQANGALRYLRARFNFVRARCLDADGNPLIPANPVQRLTRLQLWHRVERRRTVSSPTSWPPRFWISRNGAAGAGTPDGPDHNPAEKE
jgi:hypothetical protein